MWGDCEGAMTERERQYGQLVVDFVNAETTDEAGLNYIENIHEIFNYSPKFIKKAKKSFPLLHSNVESLIDKVRFYIKTRIPSLIQTKLTEDVKIDQSGNLSSSDDAMPLVGNATELEHINIMTNQQIFGMLLQWLIDRKHNNTTIIALKSVVRQYNQYSPRQLILDKNYEILEKPFFTEKEFLKLRSGDEELGLADYYDIPLIYCFVEFVKVPENKKRLKSCQECQKFYISKTLRESKFCSDHCRLKYHNRQRIESGENAEYKRQKRREGAKESYYG